MKAKIIKEFRGCRDGSRKTENLRVNGIIDGDLARVAIREGWAVSQDVEHNPTDRKWEGETVVIVASGPSLTPEQVDYCKGKARMIVVNNNYRLAPWADALYACDGEWWDEYHDETHDFQGEKWTQDHGASQKYGLKWVQGRNESGLSTDPSVIHTGSNSGYQAINLAFHFGVKRIILIGYDMQRTKNKKHWFGNHPGKLNKPGNYKQWARNFIDLANDISRQGVEVINCTRVTALGAFKQDKLENVL